MPEQDEAESLWERYEENLHLSPYIGQKQSLLALVQEERRAEREAIAAWWMRDGWTECPGGENWRVAELIRSWRTP
jgi:hypothetical protein